MPLTAAGKILMKLRTKLLDLSKRNKLISFKHSERSRKQLRFVNATISDIFERLEVPTGKLQVCALPLPEFEQADEQTPEFLDALELARAEDQAYRDELQKLGEPPPVKSLLTLEMKLRDRVRVALEMPPVIREKIISKADYARDLDIDPSFELDVQSTRKSGKRRRTELQTLLFPEEMERHLSTIYQQAKLSESEAGVNTLFLAAGFLEWYEDDASSVPIYSPISLFPVELERVLLDEEYVYTLKSREEDYSENICLIQRIAELGVKIPSPEEEESIGQYITRVQKLVSEKKPLWRVHINLTLGFFSFAKLVMYHDLGAASQTCAGNGSPAANLLLGSEEESEPSADDVIDDDLIDLKIPALVKDADSSQIRALLAVKSGKDVVIEGPPGTGKSQTITNIIASALYDGKKVLFVAEKRAALEVVKSRLDAAGLGEFCLELHSNKTRKTDVLASLDRRIKASQHLCSDKQYAKAYDEHKRIREEILAHLQQLHTEIGALGRPIFDLFWRHLRIRQLNPFVPVVCKDVHIAKSEAVTSEDIRKRSQLLEAYEKVLPLKGKYADPLGNPWIAFAHPFSTRVTRNELISKLRELRNALIEISKLLRSNATLSVDIDKDCGAVLANLAEYEDCRALPLMDITDEKIEVLLRATRREQLEAYVDSLREFQALEPLLSAQISAPFRFESREGIKRLCALAMEHNLGDTPIQNAEVIQASAKKMLDDSRRLAEHATALMTAAGLPPSTQIAELIAFYRAIELLRGVSAETLKCCNADLAAEENESFLVAALARIDRAQSLHRKSANLFLLDEPVQESELIAIARQYSQPKWWHPLLPEYWRIREKYKRISRRTTLPAAVEIVSDMDLLMDCRQSVADIEGDARLKALIPTHFRGIKTDLEPIRRVQEWLKVVRAELPTHSAWLQKLTRLLESGPVHSAVILKNKQSDQSIVEMQDILKAQSSVGVVDCEDGQARARSLIEASAEVLRIGKELRVEKSSTLDDLNQISTRLREYSRIKSRLDVLRAELSELFGTDAPSDDELNRLQRTAEYGAKALKILGKSWRETVVSPTSRRNLSELIVLFDSLSVQLQLAIQLLDGIVGLDHGTISRVSAIRKRCIRELVAQVDAALADTEALESLSEFITIEANVRAAGVLPIVDAFSKVKAPLVDLAAAYEYSVLNTLIESAIEGKASLRMSLGHELDTLRSQFLDADDRFMLTKQKRLRNAMLDCYVTAGVETGLPRDLTDLGLIKHEIAKQRKHLPIRQLIARAGTAMMELKPCVMMSPLSVAQYLRLDSNPQFDLVVMDEASQLRPEDAFGAIVRAQQTVVVGDPKQLPPTDFFISEDSDPNADADSGYDDGYESVLDLGMKSYRRIERLKWHYRSKHESLIAYSNHQFYDRELIIFPSPNNESPNFGVKLVEVNGVYDHRRNMAEAEALVAEASDFMRNNATRSLGIVAINQEQRELIEELLDRRAKMDPVVEAYRSKWEQGLEPLIVKNLENVQGDERDAIFISTVYGKTQNGEFFQRFGPITHKNGHRRLNVLFTRAKYLMRVFTSINPDDIETSSTSSLGVRSLKGFLQYARTGKLVSDSVEGAGNTDSDFELFVLQALRDHGYVVETQVGVAGFRIDLGVKHPVTEKGKFLLGIECDGAAYHSSRSARDRDKIRQRILEQNGWSIHRIWSTDWFHNPEKEIARILEKLPPIAV